MSSYNEVMDDDSSNDAVSQQPPKTKLAGKAVASDKTLQKIATTSAKLGREAPTGGGDAGAGLGGSLGKGVKPAPKGLTKAAAAAGKAGAAAARTGALGGVAAGSGVDFSSSEFVEPGLKKPAILVLNLSRKKPGLLTLASKHSIAHGLS